ncbi:MAG TPA: DHHA1 domain-containing protein, partial [Candidatus Binatus sp.]|nr:DHHA1 domain-containing protein [Candidatus Binatus sp.]
QHSRLDITHYTEITPKQWERIEQTANQVILRNLSVQASWMAREKAEAKYGFRLYQGGPVPGSKIRVVTVEGWDVEACGGTHVRRTGELGILRIEKIERVQDGIERFVFTAGEPAFRNIREESKRLNDTTRILGTVQEKVPETVRTLLKEKNELQNELEQYHEKEAETKIKRMVRKAIPIGKVRVITARLPKRKDTDIVKMANQLKEMDPAMIVVLFQVSQRVQVVAAAGEEAVKAGADMGRLVTDVAKLLGGGGGGRPFFATGGGTQKENVEMALAKASEIVKTQVTSDGPSLPPEKESNRQSGNIVEEAQRQSAG